MGSVDDVAGAGRPGRIRCKPFEAIHIVSSDMEIDDRAVILIEGCYRAEAGCERLDQAIEAVRAEM
jgi:hypothetical protein